MKKTNDHAEPPKSRMLKKVSLYWDKSKGAEICCYENDHKNMENVIKPNNIE